MAPPDLTSRPRRLHAVLGAPDGPAATAWPAPRGPAGVWPPPRPEPPPVPFVDDTPTVPLLLAGMDVDATAPPGAARVPALLRRLAPPAWRGARLHPGRPAATALVIVAAAAAVVAAVGVWSERPRAEPLAALPAVTMAAEPAAAEAAPADPGPTAAAPAPPAGPIVVSVSGKVRRPGLVEVPDGARVADVLEAAGGALPGTDLAPLNLARRVGDGEQVAVGVPPAPEPVPAPGPVGGPAAGPSAPAGPVDLNTATVADLDALPGVGPVTATRILEWRSRNGRFSRVEQLREIEGIGERRFGQLRALVTV